MIRENLLFDAAGASLHAWFYPADGAADSSPCVVIAHGWTSTKKIYLDKFRSVRQGWAGCARTRQPWLG
ncbi:hypothetical protein [Mycobacterium sp. 3519A]|uniref:hypothetical protein n=1 Tax=Mycobacterium sp. 3519A TaxID=2057184 RepID=UPI001F467B76|nr:hypothetical protein [Mycobacterium sp. 3519A]